LVEIEESSKTIFEQNNLSFSYYLIKKGKESAKYIGLNIGIDKFLSLFGFFELFSQLKFLIENASPRKKIKFLEKQYSIQ